MADNFLKNSFDLSETLYTSVFEIAKEEFEIVITKFKMVDPKWLTTVEKNSLIQSKLFILRFLRLLKKNLKSEFQNSKWPTIFGKKIVNFIESFYNLVFEVAEHEFKIGIPKCKMAEPKRPPFKKNSLIQAKLSTLRFFRCLKRNSKSKFQNSKWRTQNGRQLLKNIR